MNRDYEMPDWGTGGPEEPLLGENERQARLQHGQHGAFRQQHDPFQQRQWMSQPHLEATVPHYDRGGIATSFDFDGGAHLSTPGVDGGQFPRIDDLDIFFSSMYAYYQNRGLPAILLNQFCSTATLGFTIAFSVFLLACVDWKTLRHCHDEVSCLDFHEYIKTPFGQASIFNFVIFCYMSLFFVYWVFQVISAARNCLEGFRMESFYRRVLSISLSDLQNMQWSDVMRRLITLHDNGVYRVSIQEKLTEYDIVARIMRKENYMVALVNKGVLNMRLPWWFNQCSMWEDNTMFLTKSLEWSINFCVLQFMFNENAVVTEDFLRDVKGLQYRLVKVGVLQLVLMPFMLVFMLIHFFLENAQQFRSSQSYLGPRQWSPLALWTFREYNELPHIFEARISSSYEHANKYVSLFTNGYAATLAKFVAYISGSFVAVLVLVSVIDEAVLLYVRLSDHNLLWFLGIFSGVFAAAASFIPSQRSLSVTEGAHHSRPTLRDGQSSASTHQPTPAETTMEIIAAYTHHFPEYWMHRCHTLQVRDDFLELFPYKTKLFAMEVLSVLLTPLILCFSLPECVPELLSFMSKHTRYIDGVGDVCAYSTFDFDAYGDSNYLSPVDGPPDTSLHGSRIHSDGFGASNSFRRISTRTGRDISRAFEDKKTDGKLEQSYMSFRLANPNWEGIVGGTGTSNGAAIPIRESTRDGAVPRGNSAASSFVSRGTSFQVAPHPQQRVLDGISESVLIESDGSRIHAGETLLTRIKEYRRYMSGDSLTRSIILNSYDNRGHGSSITNSRGQSVAIPTSLQQMKITDIGQGPVLHAQDVAETAKSQHIAIPEAPTLKSVKNQISRDSVVSSVLDNSGESKDEGSSDIEEGIRREDDGVGVDPSLTAEERYRQVRGPHRDDHSRSPEGYADVIDRAVLDRYADSGVEETGHSLSIDDSVYRSINSLLRSALREEDPEPYENDFYWLNKYRSDRVRQNLTGSIGGMSTLSVPTGIGSSSSHDMSQRVREAERSELVGGASFFKNSSRITRNYFSQGGTQQTTSYTRSNDPSPSSINRSSASYFHSSRITDPSVSTAIPSGKGEGQGTLSCQDEETSDPTSASV